METIISECESSNNRIKCKYAFQDESKRELKVISYND